MKKKIMSIALSLTMALSAFIIPTAAFSGPIPELRYDDTIITPFYEDASSIDCLLSVRKSTANYELTVDGYYDVTRISATLQIQVRSSTGRWVNYGSSWTASSRSDYLSTSGTKTVSAGDTYRLKAVVTIYTSSGSSKETVYS